MKQRWAPGFTIVELLIVVVVIAILVAITVVSYNGITKQTAEAAVKSHLNDVAAQMRLELHDSYAFPSTLPANLTATSNVTVQVKSAGVETHYTGLTPVQNGVLFSVICQNLIDSGVGKGQDQGGNIQDYITGCGNWNYNKVQIGGWDNEVWDTPVDVQQLRDYGNTFTTNTSYHKVGHESTVKTFYNTLADNFIRQGGTSPLTSFWDYWASPESGGVSYQALPDGEKADYYCAEAQSKRVSSVIWHVTQTNNIAIGPC